MIYTLNEYMPRLMDPIARVEAYRDNETAAKLLSAYKERDAHIVTIADLMADKDPLTVPLLPEIGQAIRACLESHGDRLTVFCGIDAWLLLLRESMRQDFCYGLRNFADKISGFAFSFPCLPRWNTRFKIRVTKILPPMSGSGRKFRRLNHLPSVSCLSSGPGKTISVTFQVC